MNLKSLVLYAVIFGCVGLFAYSTWQSVVSPDDESNVTKEAREDILKRSGAGENTQAYASGGAACRRVDAETGLVDWEARGESIEQLAEREFSLRSCDLDLFHYGADKALRSRIRVHAGSASIQEQAGVLTDGVDIEADNGITLKIPDATVFMELKKIQSLSPVEIVQTDKETGRVVMIILGEGFQCDTSLEHFTIPKVRSVQLLDVPGDMLGEGGADDPVTVLCDGPLTVSTPDDEILFSDNVKVTRGDSFLNCDALTLAVDETTGAMGGLRAEGKADFRKITKDGALSGRGDVIEFFSTLDARHPDTGKEQTFKDVITITGKPSVVRLGEDELEAERIEVYHGDSLASAEGAVKFKLQSRKAGKSGDWFAEGEGNKEPWEGTCGRMRVSYAAAQGDSADLREVRLLDSADVRSGKRHIRGNEIHWDAVNSHGLVTGKPARLEDTDVTVVADSVQVDRALGVVTCEPLQEFKYRPPADGAKKDAAWNRVEEWDVRARSATLRYDIETRDPKDVVAVGAVTIAGGPYVATGEKVSWEFSSNAASLEGEPATLRDKDADNEVRAWTLLYRQDLGEITADRDVYIRVHKQIDDPGAEEGDAPVDDLWDVRCEAGRLWLGTGEAGADRQVNRILLERKVKVANADFGGVCDRVDWQRAGNLLTVTAAPGERLKLRRRNHNLTADKIEKTSATHMIVSGKVEIAGPWKRPGEPEESSQTGQLRADQMDVMFDEDGETMEKIVATGSPNFTQGDISADADTMTWLESSQTLLLEGRPARVRQGVDNLTALKIIYYREQNSAMGSGGVTMRFHTDKKPSIPGVENLGYEWLVTADNFNAEFGGDNSDGVKAATVQGDVRLINGDFATRGAKFVWQGERQRGTIYGDPEVLIQMADQWVTGSSVSFSPLRRNGGTNHLQISGPLRGVKPPADTATKNGQR